MNGLNSGTSSSSTNNGIYSDTLYGIFRYPTREKFGTAATIIHNKKCSFTGGERFTFTVLTMPGQKVQIKCTRSFEPGKHEGSSLELKISIIRADVGPNIRELPPTLESVCFTFDEASFVHPKDQKNEIYVLKCVFRRLDHVSSHDLLQTRERMWQAEVLKVCNDFVIRNMAYVLQCSSMKEFVRDIKGDEEKMRKICKYIKRACSHSIGLKRYFQCKREEGRIPPEINVGEILGYIFHGENRAIELRECIHLCKEANCEELVFLKELSRDHLLKNLDSMDKDGLLDVHRLTVSTEDTDLCRTTFDVFVRKEQFNYHEWRELLNIKACKITLATIFQVLHSFKTDDTSLPSPTESAEFDADDRKEIEKLKNYLKE